MSGPSERNVIEICFFSILALATAPAALGIASLPGSLVTTGWVGRLAVLILLSGCVGSLAGILWKDRRDGLAIEQAGVLFVAFGCVFYAGALVLQFSFARTAFALAMTLCVASLCVVRFIQIERLVRRFRRAAQRFRPRG